MELTGAPAAVSPRPGVVALLRGLPRRHRIAAAATGGALAIACFARYGLTAEATLDAFVCAVLVLLAAVDIDCRRIPNAIVLPATAVVLAAQIALYPDQWLEWVVASLVAALVFFLPLLVYPAGMGMGDVKLAALLGAALGKAVVGALLVGLLAGAAFAVFLLVRHGVGARKQAFAFGPFLAFGGVVALLAGAH